MKGVSAIIVAILLIVVTISVVAGFYAYSTWMASVYAAPVAVTYTGEFRDVYLATEGGFYSDFYEHTDCNITSDVIGYVWQSCVYNTTIALNSTPCMGGAFCPGQLAQTNVDGRDFTLALVYDLKGTSGPLSEVNYAMGAGTDTTGVPKSDVSLTKAELWTHEDTPTLVADLSSYISDGYDLDSAVVGRALTSGEYVLQLVFHTKVISPAFTEHDNIGRITFELQTTGDVDKAQVELDSQ